MLVAHPPYVCAVWTASPSRHPTSSSQPGGQGDTSQTRTRTPGGRATSPQSHTDQGPAASRPHRVLLFPKLLKAPARTTAVPSQNLTRGTEHPRRPLISRPEEGGSKEPPPPHQPPISYSQGSVQGGWAGGCPSGLLALLPPCILPPAGFSNGSPASSSDRRRREKWGCVLQVTLDRLCPTPKARAPLQGAPSLGSGATSFLRPPGQGLVTVLPYLPWGLGCPSRFQGPSSRLCRETVCSLPAHPF